MSDGNPIGTKPKPKKNQADKRSAKIASIVSAAGKRAPAQAPIFNRELVTPLTRQDEILLGYLTTLSDPWVQNPIAPPLMLGVTALKTEKFSIPWEVTATVNASGFAYCLIGTDRWYSTNVGTRGGSYSSFTGGTNGYPVWYSGATYAGTTGPLTTDTTARLGNLAMQLPQIDASITGNTQQRMIASGIRVAPTGAAQTASGKIYIATTTDPWADNLGLALMTQARLAAFKSDVVAVQTASLANWPSNSVLSSFAMPTDSVAFEMFYGSTPGTAVVDYPSIGVFVYGGAPNATISISGMFVYEAEKSTSFRDTSEPYAPLVDSATVMNGINGTRDAHVADTQGSHLSILGVVPKPVHQSGIHNGAGPIGFLKQLVDSQPTKVPAVKILMSPKADKSEGFFGNLSSAVSGAFNWLKDAAKELLPVVASSVATAIAVKKPIR